ncbi:hypothetical protein [Heliophilum fasciatum]|uniref:Uncharacterized protein n=1 Tax=Heliophilum fasciatum TaxID=35700 RepID=A0A4R2RYQ7_9FIRM|nr:hypothetical protein [Heliophilum fasciatum]MCW2276875.1 hypothetical protein [Heliophilum fasciatum]TCP68664.1 hypothetical protein EDD73_10260 [Heliophilum fasciatum]
MEHLATWVLEYYQINESIKDLNERKKQLKETIETTMIQHEIPRVDASTDHGQRIAAMLMGKIEKGLDKDKLCEKFGVKKSDLTIDNFMLWVEQGLITPEEFQQYKFEEQRTVVSIKKAPKGRKGRAPKSAAAE